MKVHFEATIVSQSEGVVDLTPSEVADYGQLTTDEERRVFLEGIAREEAHDEIYESVVDRIDWRLEDDE